MKSREMIFGELQNIILHLFEIPRENITVESHFFDDLNLDSIDAIDLIAHLQTMIGERLNPEDFKQIRTVGDVIDIAERMINSKNA